MLCKYEKVQISSATFEVSHTTPNLAKQTTDMRKLFDDMKKLLNQPMKMQGHIEDGNLTSAVKDNHWSGHLEDAKDGTKYSKFATIKSNLGNTTN